MLRAFRLFVFLFLCCVFNLAIAGGYENVFQLDSPNAPAASDPLSGPENFSHSARTVRFFAGYTYVHLLLSNTTESSLNVDTLNVITYQPNQLFEDDQHAIEIGMSKGLSTNMDLLLIYQQGFTEKKTGALISGGTGQGSISFKAMMLDGSFIVNPEDPVQIAFDVGATVMDVDEQIIASGVTYQPQYNSVTLDPNVGLSLIGQITNHFGLRLGAHYSANINHTAHDGNFNVFVGMVYTV